ncbi:trypco2 family protein [Streptacidiphilus sp. PAMC 29251]
MAHEPWVGLNETISAVRRELQEAMSAGASEPLKFRTGPVELEFTVSVKKEGEARTRILVLPWSADARGAIADERMHRIKLTLQPEESPGHDARISGDWAAGQR